MERFTHRFSEQGTVLKPGYVSDFEAEANRFMMGLTFGATEEMIFDDKNRGLKLYHHGPELKHRFNLPFLSSEPTGNESVFFEFNASGNFYHFVGSVNPLGHFTFVGLDRYKKTKGYSRVSVRANREIIQRVTQTLKEIELGNR